MPITCTKCTRVNPDDAIYCYNDGVSLPAPTGAQPRKAPTPVAQGAAFSQPFVFPGGQQAKNFDQLALGCQQNWAAAVEMLKRGDFEKYLAGIGRADLAMAARQAAQFPDKDRGLDQFLDRLPTQAVQKPKLQAEPMELNLGNLKPGEDKRGELKLKNTGMRLLYGSISVDGCPWITLGNPPGAQQKLFQFGSDLKIPINIRGKQLRASNKPLEGRLVVESNGGTFDIPIKAEVPVKPYPDGCMAGARSPRQIAEKAKSNPKEAAMLFEKGMVARWYKDNGWVYPVKGPAASGLGAVQQFFEALGLTPPPKVTVGSKRVDMKGEPGNGLDVFKVEIKTDEKRPVYAHGASDQPWLEVGRPILNGRIASIPLRVPNVPDRKGETLQATVTITANGNQRFRVPVFLKIGEGLNFRVQKGAGIIAGAARSKPMSKLHLLPLLLLMLCLLGIFIWDMMKDDLAASAVKFVESGGTESKTEAPPKIEPLDNINRIQVQFMEESQRFGIVCPKLRDPKNPEQPKRLTRDERGHSNNTCVRIDGYEYHFGGRESGTRWVREKGKTIKEVEVPGKDKNRAWQSSWEVDLHRIRVTQTVEIVVGEMTRLYDTALIRYQITNKDRTQHTVGLRVLLDTYIGANDGVPFYIPPTQEKPERFVSTVELFAQKDIPEFVQALETGDLNDKEATLAVVGLKLKGFEPIERMVICRWPSENGGGEARWGTGKSAQNGDWLYEPMDKNPNAKDSALVLYWAQANMRPNETRDLAFTYGLGRIVSDQSGKTGEDKTGGKMRLFCPRASLKKPFVATAYIKAVDPEQMVTIMLPSGISLADGEKAEKKVPQKNADGYSQVTWKLKASKPGEYELKADAPSIGIASERIRVVESSIFD